MPAGFDDVVQRRPGSTSRPPVTATVVNSDETGVYAVPFDGDNRHPIGPCRGPAQLNYGTVVLIVFTDAGPWIAAVDEPGGV